MVFRQPDLLFSKGVLFPVIIYLNYKCTLFHPNTTLNKSVLQDSYAS